MLTYVLIGGPADGIETSAAEYPDGAFPACGVERDDGSIVLYSYGPAESWRDFETLFLKVLRTQVFASEKEFQEEQQKVYKAIAEAEKPDWMQRDSNDDDPERGNQLVEV